MPKATIPRQTQVIDRRLIGRPSWSNVLVVVVTGGRDVTDKYMRFDALDRVLVFAGEHRLRMVLVEGGARGADRSDRLWAYCNRVRFVTERALWAEHGDAAGPTHNQLMIDKHKPDLCVAMPGGDGTAEMVKRCKRASIPAIP
jgi:YspA, cpYpsA-related SLOG family